MRDHRVKPAATTPRLVIARGEDAARNTRAAVDKMGGMRAFVKPGEVVLIKPNAAWNRTVIQAGNTNPAVVGELIRLCRDAGAKKIWVAECSVHDSEGSITRSGIKKAAQQAGAEVLLPDAASYVAVRLSKRLGAWRILEPFVRADKIINVPIAKHHGLTNVTAGMKNWIGITTEDRGQWHDSIDECIVDLAAMMRPTLTVVDATRILLRNGPQGGNLADVRQTNALAASLDPVAADAWATNLLGIRRSKVRYLELAQRRGLGTVEYRSLSPVELKT
jgi:uncharacterized protein (DUF362 family)